jgi:hypothetical protein
VADAYDTRVSERRAGMAQRSWPLAARGGGEGFDNADQGVVLGVFAGG